MKKEQLSSKKIYYELCYSKMEPYYRSDITTLYYIALFTLLSISYVMGVCIGILMMSTSALLDHHQQRRLSIRHLRYSNIQYVNCYLMNILTTSTPDGVANLTITYLPAHELLTAHVVRHPC